MFIRIDISVLTLQSLYLQGTVSHRTLRSRNLESLDQHHSQCLEIQDGRYSM